MIISLIWAMTDQRVIGINNSLPWKLPADMKWFRQHTLGKPIIMGRATFESFGSRPLPERPNIIVTRNPSYAANAQISTSIEQALKLAGNVDEVMIIGGASLYEQTLPIAHRLYMTMVHADCQGDAWFPPFDIAPWEEVQRVEQPADEKNPHDCSFLILERKS